MSKRSESAISEEIALAEADRRWLLDRLGMSPGQYFDYPKPTPDNVVGQITALSIAAEAATEAPLERYWRARAQTLRVIAAFMGVGNFGGVPGTVYGDGPVAA